MMKYLVIGFGRSGKAAAKLLAENNDVTLWDMKPEESFDASELQAYRALGIRCCFGADVDPSGWDEVILSPGVPCDLPFVEAAKAAGARISGEIELAYENCPGTFFAITGTNGKTTVTTLVGEMVKAAGMDCRVVGNIGNPATEVCREVSAETVMVTEISSFQLETVHSFRPHVAAMLNLTPDHLDRHKTFENYASLKVRITENQMPGDYFVYNYEDACCAAAAEKTQAFPVPFSAERKLPVGAYTEDGKIMIAKENERPTALCRVDELQIPGHHNLENALAAAAIACFGGVTYEAVVRTLKSFCGVEHRMEFVRSYRNVRYVNDSKGTNPDSTIKAIEATDTPILLIAGGYEKNSDFHELIDRFDGKVKLLLLLGATAERLRTTAVECGFPASAILMCSDMKDCVQKASLLAKTGDTVLLSPACASWGMYRNFEERGDDFRELVNGLQ